MTSTQTATSASGVTSQTPQPTASEIERIRDSIESLRTAVDSLKTQSIIRDWGPIVAALVTAVVALFSIVRTSKLSKIAIEQNKAALAENITTSKEALQKNIEMSKAALQKNIEMAKETLAEKAREEDRKAIRSQIDEFYGPFLQLRNASKFLYVNAFIPRRTNEEREKYEKDGHFPTLIALVRVIKFKGVDLDILKQIVDIGTKTSALIYGKVGLVDDPELQIALAQATTHFKIMELSLEGTAFIGGGEEFEKFVFPHDLDDKLQAKLGNLNARLKKLISES